MKVLVVGSGSREHALTWRLRKSPQVLDIWVAGGNFGTAQIATNLPLSPDDVRGIVGTAQRLDIDLVVVGPEQPLTDGLVDELREAGIAAFGPDKAAARLEASKSFARRVMTESGIPCPDYRVFGDESAALDFLRAHAGRVVVKADGLAAGKGVALCSTVEESVIALKGCMSDRIFGAAGETVVIEDWLEGVEVSVFAFSDGENISAPVAACDYKQVHDGDHGPNTGGMGSFSPPAFWTADLADQVCREVLSPTIEAMADRGCPYRGMLYAGLMFTRDGPKVLEFNCRFGDPEAQVILPLMESDPVEIMQACIDGTLATTPVNWSERPHVGVVMVSGGYPGAYETGREIFGLDADVSGDSTSVTGLETLVFHAGSQPAMNADGKTVAITSGGRVLTVVGNGDTLEEARARAYSRAEQISFEGSYYRRDIGSLNVGNRQGILT
ncbi:MAG: phosphoribosylamine--glycine ligase [Chloroflexi bacterium]|nr:phosphoribosylamine--glycine ligase [Chloroflexota bacterium]